ncbi:MAG: Minf_1886 family protein [Verrucomicrobiota bacterium]
MHASALQDAIRSIVTRDSRFDPDAYLFLKEALDFTLKRAKEENEDSPRHVSGKELLIGFRDHSLEQFGPIAFTVLREWGVHTCTHVGEMVFHLINEQIFGKQDSDTLEDFAEIFTFHDAFIAPFLPEHNPTLPAA